MNALILKSRQWFMVRLSGSSGLVGPFGPVGHQLAIKPDKYFPVAFPPQSPKYKR